MTIKQTTLRTPIRSSGVGIHSGKSIHMVLRPAPAGTGIVFRRVDFEPAIEIQAHATLVTDTTLSTKISKGDVGVGTTEHLLSALSGLGVDNCLIDLDGPEVPIMDGSAWNYVFQIRSAGICEQDAPREFIRILKPITVVEDGKQAELRPYDGFRLRFDIDFDHPAFDEQPSSAQVDMSPSAYIREVARARTFGFKRDIDRMRSMNLALGGSMDNAILVDDDGVANEEGLRFNDEFVKHKLLDAVGDLYMVGNLLGEYRGTRSGHALNNKLVRVMLQQIDAWDVVTMTEDRKKTIQWFDGPLPVQAM